MINFYGILGLPGCIGSIDCVHIGWDCCPAGNRSDAAGAKGHPTLSFEVIVSHTRRILGVSRAFWGTWNDKTIVRYDETVKTIKQVDTYTRYQWRTYASDGSTIVHIGLYLICDGGYHKWLELIPPYKHQIDGTPEKRWSKWVESIRKDVECSFGIMKKRFMNIKNHSRYHNKETLETIFYCCAVLHNMNHHYDCYDEKVHDADELQELLSFQNNPQPNEEPVGTVYGNCKDFVARRIALINHFVYCRDELDKKFADHRSFS